MNCTHAHKLHSTFRLLCAQEQQLDKNTIFLSSLQVSIVPYDTASSNKSSAVICGLCTIPLDGDVINRLVDDLDCCCDSTLVKSPINTMEKPKFSSSLCAITKFYVSVPEECRNRGTETIKMFDVELMYGV